MALPPIPNRHQDSSAHRQRIAETVNGITSFQFDDSRVRTPAEITAGVTPVNYAYEPNNVMRYGAKGDRTTDDLAAFNTAAAVAVYSKEIYIPPLQAGYYYKLSDAWVLDSLDSVVVYGAGVQSLLVIANASGANCITLDATAHAMLRNFGIYGTSGSAHGIELVNDSHYNTLRDLWIGWCDGDGIRNTLGISTTFINVHVDQNNGFRPASLVGGLTDGAIKHAFYVPSTATGRNNNPTFIGCHANGAGDTVSVQIGDGGALPISSFNWHGGLIQGSSVYKELYLVTKDSVIHGAHVESTFTTGTSNWGVTLDGCANTVIRNSNVNADVRMIGAISNSGVENCLVFGVDLGTGCDACFVRDTSYGNSSTGPSGGSLKDAGNRSDLRRLINASNSRFSVGHFLDSPVTYFATNMEDWVGGGSPTVPCGFTSFGTPTITRDSGTRRTGSYSVKVVHSSDLNEGFQITIAPASNFAGKKVTVEAWVYNLTTAGLAYVSMVEGGTGVTVSQQSFYANTWERMVVTFFPDASATSVTLQFTALTGTVYWDSIHLKTDDFTPIRSNDLDTVASPTISYGGRPLRELAVAASATNVTGFSDPHIGQRFTLRFSGNRTIAHGAPVLLNGAANFAGTANDTLTLMYSIDGNFYEIGRAVI